MHAKTVYYTYAKHVRIIYTPKLFFFVSIPQAFVFIWRTIYAHFHETGLIFPGKQDQSSD